MGFWAFALFGGASGFPKLKPTAAQIEGARSVKIPALDH